MARYIDDKNINDFLCEGIGCNECSFKEIDGELGCLLFERIGKLPSADVRENVRGEWEQVVSGCAILMRCNQCKNAISENDFFEICRKVNHGSKLLDFCPNCGSYNGGKKNENRRRMY